MKNMTSNLALIVQKLLFCNTCACKPKFAVCMHESYMLETNSDLNFRSNIQHWVTLATFQNWSNVGFISLNKFMQEVFMSNFKHYVHG